MFNKDYEINKYCGNGMKRLKNICNPILKKIGGISESDYDDFYSIANVTVWDAAKRFDETLHDNFDVFLKVCIQRKFKTELTRRNRDRRVPSSLITSSDLKISEDTDSTLGELIPDKYSLEDEYIDKETNRVNKYMDSLSKTQKKIATLVLDGYELCDIQKMLDIDEVKFHRLVKKMSSFEKKILLKNA